MSYPQIVLVFHLWKTLVDNSVDNPGQSYLDNPGQSYFHCVETPNPAAMKPKPTTMFQLPRASMGSEPSVT